MFLPSVIFEDIPRILKSFFLIIAVISLNHLNGQNPYSQNLGSINGLASNNVYFSFQDREGYMWFGTDMGVSRFNGYEFENFNALNGMLGNEIFSIHQDRKDRIWFLSLNGELTYYLHGAFHNSKNDSLLSKFKSDKHWSSFLEDRTTGDIYIASISNGIYKLGTSDDLHFYEMKNQIFSLWQNSENEICFFSASEGIMKFNGDKIELISALNFSESYVRTTFIDNALFIGYQKSVYKFTDSVRLFWNTPDNAEIIWLSSNEENKLIIGTRDGVKIEKEGNSSFDSNFQGRIVSSTFFDREGNYWVTTIGHGVFFSPSSEIKLLSKEINNQQVTSVNFDSRTNSIWLGLVNGKFCSMNSDSITFFKTPDGNQQITSINSFDEGIFISSKEFFGIIKPENINFIEYLSNDILVTDEWIYIGSNKLFKLDKQSIEYLIKHGHESKLIEEELLKYNVLTNSINVLCKGKKSDVYIGTRNSLFIDENGVIKDLSKSNEFLSTAIYDLVYDSLRNYLYVGTFNHGVLVVEDKNVLFSLNVKHGLSSNNCQSLELDLNGHLWIGTSNGLDKISMEKGRPKVENFSKKIGLADMKYTDIEVANDLIYLATDIGLIICPVSGINEKKVPPTISLSGVSINGINRPDQDLTKLKYDENSLAFKFQGLGMRELGNLNYLYRLEGYQSNWKITKNRIVTYESLDPGNFNFQVKAVNGDGIESEVANIAIVINPAFWRTSWFIGSTVGVVILILIFIWRRKTNNFKEKYALEKQIIAAELERLEFEKAYLEAEQKAGVLQMNPHFLFNSLNAIKGFYAEGKNNEGNQFLVKFSKLLRNILECNTQFIPLEKEIEILTIYLELMRKRHDNFFNFKIENLVPTSETIEIPPMLLQPIVENAVIHGVSPNKSGDILVTFKTEKNDLICSVFDNGVGFANSVKTLHNSMGISSIKDRLDLLSRQLNFKCELQILDKTESEYKTQIRIRLPLKTSK